MKIVHGDIWAYLGIRLIVVPTNIGWRSTGANVMGRGLARQAAERYPGLDTWYGVQCKKHGKDTPVLEYPDGPLILFPVKPLNAQAPGLSWKSGADTKLIERSTKELAAGWENKKIAVCMVGCGAGGLDPADVLPILEKHLTDDRFLLVTPWEIRS